MSTETQVESEQVIGLLVRKMVISCRSRKGKKNIKKQFVSRLVWHPF